MELVEKAKGRKEKETNKAYSRAGEGDDQKVADDWNDHWIKEYWSDFLKELDGDTNNRSKK